MEVRKGYKQTEAGIIPEDWGVWSFKEISSMKGRIGWQGLKQIEFTMNPDEPYLITGMNFKDGEIRWDEVYHVPMERYEIAKEIQLKIDDVLMTKDGTIGKLLFINKIPYPGKATLNSHLLVFRPIRNSYVPKFLYYQLTSKTFKDYIELSKSGTTFFGISQEAVGKYKAFFPPTKAEQTVIATALSDTDALIGSLEKFIEKKRNIKQGTIQELLSGRKRLPGFEKKAGYKLTDVGIIPVDWDVKNLKDISFMKGRIGWQGLKETEFTMNLEEPFLITGMNFKDGQIRWNEVYHVSFERYEVAKNIQLKIGDLLITKDGTIGKLLFVDTIPYPNIATLNSHLLVLRPLQNNYVPKFLYYQLASETFKDYIELSKSGSTFFGISQEAMGNYKTILPTVVEQTAIATVLSDMDAEIEALEQKLLKYRMIKQGMMQELLTGKTRLI